MHILINNEWVSKKNAKISIFSDAALYGFGLFETFRTYPEKIIIELKAHIRRMLESSEKIGLDIIFHSHEIEEMVWKVVNKSEDKIQRIKILAIPDNLIIASTRLEINESIYKGVSIKSKILTRAVPEIKSTSYLDCIVSYNGAQEAGYFDALLIDKNKSVYECSRSNIFWFENDLLFTRRSDVLPGITRKIILERSPYNVSFNNISIDNLLQKKEVFITNSVIGIIPVISIDNYKINNSIIGKNTQKLMTIYKNMYLV